MLHHFLDNLAVFLEPFDSSITRSATVTLPQFSVQFLSVALQLRLNKIPLLVHEMIPLAPLHTHCVPIHPVAVFFGCIVLMLVG